MSFERLFGLSTLNVVVPDTSVPYPPQGDADEWLASLDIDTVERKQAFFDEQLHSFLTVRIDHPTSPSESPPNAEHPPEVLLSLLAHTQISLEATYISSLPNPTSEPPPTSQLLSAPPRTAVPPKPSTGTHLQIRAPHHPSIHPPETPNPTPQSGEQDKRYAASEGTLLVANVWGANKAEDAGEAFTLLWSEREDKWVAIYRLSVTVSFLRLNFADPLLCLTVSATLREKPLAINRLRHPLAEYLSSVGSQLLPNPQSPTTPAGSSELPTQENFDGLEEANILEGLHAGPRFSSPSIHLPTSRLGTVSRQKLFSLPPVSLPVLAAPTPSPMTAVRTAHPTLRKSYRKTLPATSGFKVRMRTVFVPYVLLPDEMAKNISGSEDGGEVGSDERTVVLCVEVQNSGEAGPGVGFLVEKVNVKVGGEGAKAVLIKWGEGCFDPEPEEGAGEKEKEGGTFPLRVGSMAQYNLLYAVSFLHSPEEVEGFSLARGHDKMAGEKGNGAASELQRAVTINIFGKPYLIPRPGQEEEAKGTPSFPTRTFSSRWNCILDLSPHPSQPPPLEEFDSNHTPHQALPEPLSPFPTAATPRTPQVFSPDSGGGGGGGSTPGSKRHTIQLASAGITMLGTGGAAAGAGAGGRSPRPGPPRTMSLFNPLRKENKDRDSLLAPPGSVFGSPRNSYIPPSTQMQIPPSPTTYSAPPPPPFPITALGPAAAAPPVAAGPPAPNEVSWLHQFTQQQQLHHQERGGTPPHPPPTPAYPPYSATFPGAGGGGGGTYQHQHHHHQPPMSAAAANVGHNVGSVGPSVEVRRGMGGEGGLQPQTPGPWVGAGVNGGGTGGGFAAQQMMRKGYGHPKRDGDGDGEGDIVVSVGLLSVDSGKERKAGKDGGEGRDPALFGPGRIYPFEYFTLDIFVFNRSRRVRRFEVSCPDRTRRGRRPPPRSQEAKKMMAYPGVLPMDARVRIGPLLPQACQSVRMRFLAMSPGVHSIDTLALTDVETGFLMNLRSVMDVVVHDPCVH